MIRYFLLWLSFSSLSLAQNSKCGIDVTYSGTLGVDFCYELPWHVPTNYDIPVVYLKSTSTISFSHNARNVAADAVANERSLRVIGANGKNGIAADGDEGYVRYSIDTFKTNRRWAHENGWEGGSTASRHTRYTAPINLATETYYGVATLVLGTTGTNSYDYGLLDAAGDEYHIIQYADDDTSFAIGNTEVHCSDGKYHILCVNPKTPCLTLTKTGTGQFYTTPAWTLNVPKIHAQTSYVSANVTLTFTDLEDADITYRIDGGAWTTTTSPAALNSSVFSTGSHTLEYKSERGTEPVKTRTVVKNPTHPYSGSSWDAGYLALVEERKTRHPFNLDYNSEVAALPAAAALWNAVGGQGFRLGGNMGVKNIPGAATGAERAPRGANNFALFGRVLGYNTVTNGKSYGVLAKEMMLDGMLNTSFMGLKRPTGTQVLPVREWDYRGYWDIYGVQATAGAYRFLAADFRDDQHADGMTAIESYFVRDLLASWVHVCMLRMGGWVGSETVPGSGANGMWFGSHLVASTNLICTTLQDYSTPYYGTSGMDGNTTTYLFVPYASVGYTWKQILLTHNYTVGAQYNYPFRYYGMSGNTSSTDLIKADGNWKESKLDYSSWSQMGAVIANYWNTKATYDPAGLAAINGVNLYIDKCTTGDLRSANEGPKRFVQIGNLNALHPTASANSNAFILAQADYSAYSDETAIIGSGGWLSQYDPDYFGGGGPPPTPPTVTSVVVNGATVTFNFSASVTGVSAAHYSLSGGLSLSAASGLGPIYTMTVSPPASYGSTYTCSYSPSGTTVDDFGNALASFSGFSVTNSTPAPAPSGRNPGLVRGRGKLGTF